VRPERLRLTPPTSEAYNTIDSTVLGEVFEGILVNITLASPSGRPVTLTMSNDGEVPGVGEGSRLQVHFAAANARVLPKSGLASE